MTAGNSHKVATPVDKKLTIKSVPRPVAVKNTIVVKNKVAGLNFADIHQVHGKFPLAENGILGLEG